MITEVYECKLKFSGKVYLFDNTQLPRVLPVLAQSCQLSPELQAKMLEEGSSVEGREFLLRRVQ
jgi:hypothetical protein